MADLNDEDCPDAIRKFVRGNPDIVVDDYIQRGRNGEVYFGKRNKLGDEVVLKFYFASPGFDASEEAVVLRAIDHPNILRVFDLRFLPPYWAYFLTPKISGGDLQAIIENGTLSSHSAINICSGILIGLNELHSNHSIVHRDLKPGNILFDLATQRPIIADLGSIKKIEADKNVVTASKSTYLYLPPESILKDEYYFQSDIYQVGIILFQLLGGAFPLNDDLEWLSEKEIRKVDLIRNARDRSRAIKDIIATKIVKGKLLDLDSLPMHLDGQFKRIIRKATHIDPNRRYANTALFLRDLHHLTRNTPNYLDLGDSIEVHHANGRKFKYYIDAKDNLILEKSVGVGNWRRDNSHDGSFESVLSIARGY